MRKAFLGINVSHGASAALLINGKIVLVRKPLTQPLTRCQRPRNPLWLSLVVLAMLLEERPG